MGALLAVVRGALPWVASMLGGWAVSDWFNERMKAKQNETKPDDIKIIKGVFSNNPEKWKFLALGGMVVGALTVFITKKLK